MSLCLLIRPLSTHTSWHTYTHTHISSVASLANHRRDARLQRQVIPRPDLQYLLVCVCVCVCVEDDTLTMSAESVGAEMSAYVPWDPVGTAYVACVLTPGSFPTEATPPAVPDPVTTYGAAAAAAGLAACSAAASAASCAAAGPVRNRDGATAPNATAAAAGSCVGATTSAVVSVEGAATVWLVSPATVCFVAVVVAAWLRPSGMPRKTCSSVRAEPSVTVGCNRWELSATSSNGS